MTTIDYKALAERINEYLRRLEALDIAIEPSTFLADLRTLVSLLEGMTEQEPVAWITEDGERVVTANTMNNAVKDGGATLSSMRPYSVPLYAHPAPQPIAIPAPFMHLLGHAYGLSLGTDWNRGTYATHYRRPLLDAVAECKRWLGSAPQPQPERQPVSEPRSCTDPMSLAVALDFADNPRPYHTLQAPADTNGELYRALRVLAAAYRAVFVAKEN